MQHRYIAHICHVSDPHLAWQVIDRIQELHGATDLFVGCHGSGARGIVEALDECAGKTPFANAKTYVHHVGATCRICQFGKLHLLPWSFIEAHESCTQTVGKAHALHGAHM